MGQVWVDAGEGVKRTNESGGNSKITRHHPHSPNPRANGGQKVETHPECTRIRLIVKSYIE